MMWWQAEPILEITSEAHGCAISIVTYPAPDYPRSASRAPLVDDVSNASPAMSDRFPYGELIVRCIQTLAPELPLPFGPTSKEVCMQRFFRLAGTARTLPALTRSRTALRKIYP